MFDLWPNEGSNGRSDELPIVLDICAYTVAVERPNKGAVPWSDE